MYDRFGATRDYVPGNLKHTGQLFLGADTCLITDANRFLRALVEQWGACHCSLRLLVGILSCRPSSGKSRLGWVAMRNSCLRRIHCAAHLGVNTRPRGGRIVMEVSRSDRFPWRCVVAAGACLGIRRINVVLHEFVKVAAATVSFNGGAAGVCISTHHKAISYIEVFYSSIKHMHKHLCVISIQQRAKWFIVEMKHPLVVDWDAIRALDPGPP